MPATIGFQFVESDLSLIHHVHQLRLATIEQLAELAGRSYKRTADRLMKLEAEKYLKCVTRLPQKHVYVTGREGVAALIREGYAPQELAQKRFRRTELKELGIKHAIFISDVHVKLLQLTRARSLELVNWVEGPVLWDRATTSNNIVIPIRPDALFTIAWPDGKRRVHFFVEADRGTMAHSRMREKITGYAAYYQQQLHLKKYDGMKHFRVLTATQTRGRADGLMNEFRAMMQPAWLAAYPVIAFEDLTLERLMPELVQRGDT